MLRLLAKRIQRVHDPVRQGVHRLLTGTALFHFLRNDPLPHRHAKADAFPAEGIHVDGDDGDIGSMLVPGCFLGGASFCLLCDLLARILFAPTELGISTVTAVFGAPVVLWILVRRKREGVG